MITSYGLNINKFHTHGILGLKWKFTAKQLNFSWLSTSFKSFWAGNRIIISQWFWNWASNVKVIKARGHQDMSKHSQLGYKELELPHHLKTAVRLALL